MRPADIVRLLLLAAAWSSAFIFVRVAVPYLGPIAMAFVRTLIGGVCLALWLHHSRRELALRAHWRFYLLIGLTTSALPFSLHAYAAQFIPASFSVLVNATSPLFGGLFAWLLLGERLGGRALAGMAIGVAGVAFLTLSERLVPSSAEVLAVAAALAACACYGLSGAIARRKSDTGSSGPEPFAVAAGSQLAASLMLIALLPASPPLAMPTPGAAICALLAGLLGSALAYALYFRLIADIGPTRALTVTFIMPAFGMLGGALFLDELIDARMIAGAVMIVIGTALVLMKPAGAALKTPSAG